MMYKPSQHKLQKKICWIPCHW